MCTGNGDVTALSTCNCLDGGAGHSDYCASPSCEKSVNCCGMALMKNRGTSARLLRRISLHCSRAPSC